MSHLKNLAFSSTDTAMGQWAGNSRKSKDRNDSYKAYIIKQDISSKEPPSCPFTETAKGQCPAYSRKSKDRYD